MLEEFLAGHLLTQVGQSVGPLVEVRLVYLEDVAGKHHLGPLARTGDDGLDLMRGEVLRLIDDEEGLAEAAAADIGQRRDHEFLVLQQALDLKGFLGRRAELRLDDVEVVHQGLQVRTHLGLLVTWKESDVLVAQDYGRARQDDLVEVALLLEGGGQGEQGFTRTGTAGEGNELDLRIQAGVERELLLVIARSDAVGLAGPDNSLSIAVRHKRAAFFFKLRQRKSKINYLGKYYYSPQQTDI